MDSLYLIMFIGLSFFVLFLFFYILKVEKTFEEKLNSFEMSIENINRDIFLLKKEIKNISSDEKITQLENIVDSLVDDMRNLEKKYIAFENSIKSEISSIHSNIKKTKMVESNFINKNDEEKIINLYKNGYSIEDISKTLRIPAGEVEFIVKFLSKT